MKDLNAAIHHNNGNMVLKLLRFKTATIINISKTECLTPAEQFFCFLYGLRCTSDLL